MKINEQTPLIITNDNILYLNKQEQQFFISKVYRTILLQLMYSFSFIYLTISSSIMKNFLTSDTGNFLLVISFYTTLILTISIFSCLDFVKEYPYNYLYVIYFTVCTSYFLSYLCMNIPINNLILSGTSSSLIVSSLSLYAYQTKINYTQYGNYLLILLMMFLLFGFFQIFLENTYIYSLLGLGVFSSYLVYDTQLILGRQQIKYRPGDYLLATINIYLDIINLFIFILDLINGR